MASRSVWSGFICFGLASVPVKAYTGAVSGCDSEVRFNQLHRDCNSRIQYKNTCPIHGEVSIQDIVQGYAFSQGQYVVVDPAELFHRGPPDDGKRRRTANDVTEIRYGIDPNDAVSLTLQTSRVCLRFTASPREPRRQLTAANARVV